MSSTHTCLRYHLVFGTKHQATSMLAAWRDRLHAYFGGLVKTSDGVPLAVGGVSDHVHLLVSLKPTHRLSEFMRDIKAASSRWVHEEIEDRSFAWQDGYGAFTVSASQTEAVRRYVNGQEEHHRTRTFREEYVTLLRKAGIEFKEEYLW